MKNQPFTTKKEQSYTHTHTHKSKHNFLQILLVYTHPNEMLQKIERLNNNSRTSRTHTTQMKICSPSYGRHSKCETFNTQNNFFSFSLSMQPFNICFLCLLLSNMMWNHPIPVWLPCLSNA